MKLFRKLLLAWMIAWLPAAGVLAATMPLTGSVSAAASAIGSDSGAAFMPCHGKSGAAGVPFAHGCSHCVLCHLAGALVIPEMPFIATFAADNVFLVSPPLPAHSFVPELSSPPPRAPLA